MFSYHDCITNLYSTQLPTNWKSNQMRQTKLSNLGFPRKEISGRMSEIHFQMALDVFDPKHFKG